MDEDTINFETPDSTEPSVQRGYYCAKCGYNLIGIAMGDPCPECGSDFLMDNPYSQRCSKAIASMILWIMSIMTCMFYGVPGLVCGILAIIFAKQARAQVHMGQAPQFSLDFAKAGRVCGWIGLGLSVVFLLLVAAYLIFIVVMISSIGAGGGFAPVPPAPTPMPLPIPTP
ncbi:MAG: hypothetical protein JKY96_09265 [Phycisphaerales bacterium]|nr:hypothetical protein [Phycisphaerales bacterium]